VARAGETGAHRERGDQQRRDVQLIDRPRRADDIDDRIDGADLMEVDGSRGGAMTLASASASASKIAIALRRRGRRSQSDRSS